MDSSLKPKCQALNLSDQRRCAEIATANNNIFCRFHARQCYGMYMGYKRRNAHLDDLPAAAPHYLKSSTIPLANMAFEDVENESTLKAIHLHLFREYVLLGNVIDARRLHHKHFYSLQMDYGHQSYLDTLSNRRHIVLRVLEKLEKRHAEVLYQKEKWFEWVRQVQKEDEDNREKEHKKVKAEAAMFKRHWERMQAQIKSQREKEEKQRQDAFLEETYQERLKTLSLEDDDEKWDPIEDVNEDEREQYIHLIKHFLWLELLPEEDISTSAPAPSNATGSTGESSNSNSTKTKKPKKKSKSNARKKADATKKANGQQDSNGSKTQKETRGHSQDRILDMPKASGTKTQAATEPDKGSIETELEMRKRLKEGVERNFDSVERLMVVRTMHIPRGAHPKTPPLADEEIESLTRDIKEIKLLLFCRLLLSHTSLLPAALCAPSIEEFLNNPSITKSDLRDLCLRVEQPSLQDIRDACADLSRGDEPEEEEEVELFEAEETVEDIVLSHERYGHLHDENWLYMNIGVHMHGGSLKLEEAGSKRRNPERMKVTICGKSIWNYSSQASMSRNGWLQFSVLAKDCDLRKAVGLCRNWNEFTELHFLTTWNHFPAPQLVSWSIGAATMQLHELGFFPCPTGLAASLQSYHHQTGGRGQSRRHHSIVESRNIIAGHMRRNDSATRRFIQYCTMRTGELLILVHHGKTGKIVTSPPHDEMWVARAKHGLGRASKKEWDFVSTADGLLNNIEGPRQWRPGFDDHYDILIWDFAPGRKASELYSDIAHELKRARRITDRMDVHRPREQFLRGLTWEENTMRVRSINPGEQVKSLWDNLDSPHPKSFYVNPMTLKTVEPTDERSLFLCYTEADAAEDMILFPDELISTNQNVTFKEINNPTNKFEIHPATVLQYITECTKKIVEKTYTGPDIGSSSKTIWTLPRIWADAVETVDLKAINAMGKLLLQRVGLLEENSGRIGSVGRDSSNLYRKTLQSDKVEVIERDRGKAMAESFHLADLEPGGPERYEEMCKIIEGIQAKTRPNRSAGWVFFLAEILAWLEVRADYDTYTHEPSAPWPHAFIIHDIVKAFSCMAIFFPDITVCSLATEFFESAEGSEFQNSLLLDPLERSKTIPKYRTRTSYQHRDKSFWKEWEGIFDKTVKKREWYTDKFPLKWSVAIRPIIAKFYRAGVIKPSRIQADPGVVPGIAIANTEPHRPDELDLFIEYADRSNILGNVQFPQDYVHPHQWPDLLNVAREFAAVERAKRGQEANPRFALLRLWSTPHFWPLMISNDNRRLATFLDPVGRVWEWHFVPKDVHSSEWVVFSTLRMRLDLFQKQFGDRVVQRGDVVLVMGETQTDLLRHAVAVTLAIQTRPWCREFDLWKSFVNVDLEFLEGLDPYWMD